MHLSPEVALAAVRSKAVVLLLLLIVAPIGGSVFVPCFVVHCILSSFAIILMGKRELFALFCLSS